MYIFIFRTLQTEKHENFTHRRLNRGVYAVPSNTHLTCCVVIALPKDHYSLKHTISRLMLNLNIAAYIPCHTVDW